MNYNRSSQSIMNGDARLQSKQLQLKWDLKIKKKQKKKNKENK